MTLSLLKLSLILMELTIYGNVFTNLENLKTSKLYSLLQQYHKYKYRTYYEARQTWQTSNLGTFLFKNNFRHNFKPQNRTFLIVYWKYWHWINLRHEGELFDTCSVKNCNVSSEDKDLTKADAVVIHIQHGDHPYMKRRPPSQRWIFMSDESPVNVFTLAPYPPPTMKEWENMFNWTMTYRTDSDVPIPYGRTIPLPTLFSPGNLPESVATIIPNWKTKKRNVYITALISHCCVPDRESYIKELQKHIEVDIYGKCSPNFKHVCPGHCGADCPVINHYFFYLAFENTKCRQYITEKTFHNSYEKGSIPIIMGAPKKDCDKLLPPHSFLHVETYPNPKDLAIEIKRIMKNQDVLLMYHNWRRYFNVVNEHGYFRTKSLHMCRVCEALNYNDEAPKIYSEDDLKLFFEPKLVCNY